MHRILFMRWWRIMFYSSSFYLLFSEENFRSQGVKFTWWHSGKRHIYFSCWYIVSSVNVAVEQTYWHWNLENMKNYSWPDSLCSVLTLINHYETNLHTSLSILDEATAINFLHDCVLLTCVFVEKEGVLKAYVILKYLGFSKEH